MTFVDLGRRPVPDRKSWEAPMQLLERFLVRLDGGPWIAVSRVALGFVIAPAFRTIAAEQDQVVITLALLLALLIGLRVLPALLRGALPFSAEARSIWSQRRQVAKIYDSYQWQKLFWIGLGLLAFAAVSGGQRTGELVIMVFCLIGGTAGLLLWQRNKAGVEIV
jgi:hypothetical protein